MKALTPLPAPILTPEQAHRRGLHPLTTACGAHRERWMLLNFAADMLRGGIAFAFVASGTDAWLEVWRAPASNTRAHVAVHTPQGGDFGAHLITAPLRGAVFGEFPTPTHLGPAALE